MTTKAYIGASQITVPANASGVSATVNGAGATLQLVTPGLYNITAPAVNATDPVVVTYSDAPQLASPDNYWKVLAKSAVAVSCPADITEDALAIIPVPAGVLGPNGVLRLTAGWAFTNNANNKTLRVRFGGAAGPIIGQAVYSTQVAAQFGTISHNRNAANSQYSFGLAFAGAVISGPTPSAVDTTQAISVYLTGQKALAGDVLTLESYLVEVLYGA